MKRNVWMKNWIVATLLVGVVCYHTPLFAQEENQPPAARGTSSNAVNDTTAELTVDTNESDSMEAERSSRNWRGPVIVVGGSATLRTNESAEVVVAIGGSARAGGKVQDAVVAIGGNARAESDVGAAVVAVGGNSLALGKVGEA